MNTLSMFMAPVARKFNLLRFFGNFLIGLRKELRGMMNVDVPPEGDFLSSMFHTLVFLAKVGVLFIAVTILPALIIGNGLNNLNVIGQLIFTVAAVDYLIACLETYDEQPEGDE